MAGQVTRSGSRRYDGSAGIRRRSVVGVRRQFTDALRWLGMAYDVARVRGLHPSLGDGWVHFDAQAGMLLPDSVATTVSTAFRASMPTPRGRIRRRGAARRCWTPPARRWPTWSTPTRRGVVLGADRAVLLTPLADASSSRVGLGYEIVVTRLDDEANIAPWLRAANRYGAKVKWAEVDIETGRSAGLAVGEPDHQADPARRDHVGVVDLGHRHRPAAGDQARARRRRTGGRRPLRRRALPADRHRRDRRRRGRAQRGRLGRPADRRAGVP